jgi:hypothetical protein
MSFFGGSRSSSNAPQARTSADAKNAVIADIRMEMSVNTAQTLIDVFSLRFIHNRRSTKIVSRDV